jgi:hypothetical protein
MITSNFFNGSLAVYDAKKELLLASSRISYSLNTRIAVLTNSIMLNKDAVSFKELTDLVRIFKKNKISVSDTISLFRLDINLNSIPTKNREELQKACRVFAKAFKTEGMNIPPSDTKLCLAAARDQLIVALECLGRSSLASNISNLTNRMISKPETRWQLFETVKKLLEGELLNPMLTIQNRNALQKRWDLLARILEKIDAEGEVVSSLQDDWVEVYDEGREENYDEYNEEQLNLALALSMSMGEQPNQNDGVAPPSSSREKPQNEKIMEEVTSKMRDMERKEKNLTTVTLQGLPAEIIAQIFSYLTPHERNQFAPSKGWQEITRLLKPLFNDLSRHSEDEAKRLCKEIAYHYREMMQCEDSSNIDWIPEETRAVINALINEDHYELQGDR